MRARNGNSCPEILVALPTALSILRGKRSGCPYVSIQQMHDQETNSEACKPAALWRRLFSLKKLPGIVFVIIGLGWRFLDWGGRLDVLWRTIEAFGGNVSMMVSIVSSPLFSVGLIFLGLSYVIFVGEPVVATIRNPFIPILGWGLVIVCMAFLGAISLFGYFVSGLTDEPDALYQNLTRVAHVESANIDNNNKTVILNNVLMPSGTLLDLSTPFIFHHMRLTCSGKPFDAVAASRLPQPVFYEKLTCRME
jgi:hypothetical protein